MSMPVTSRSATAQAPYASRAATNFASSASSRDSIWAASIPAAALEASAPGTARSSTTMSRTPRFASSRAVAQPITPPPTITTRIALLSYTEGAEDARRRCETAGPARR
jgi:hypothetical protein